MFSKSLLKEAKKVITYFTLALSLIFIKCAECTSLTPDLAHQMRNSVFAYKKAKYGLVFIQNINLKMHSP